MNKIEVENLRGKLCENLLKKLQVKISRKTSNKKSSIMMKISALCIVLVIANANHINAIPEIHFKTEIIKSYELYMMRVSPNLFNWTRLAFEQFR